MFACHVCHNAEAFQAMGITGQVLVLSLGILPFLLFIGVCVWTYKAGQDLTR